MKNATERELRDAMGQSQGRHSAAGNRQKAIGPPPAPENVWRGGLSPFERVVFLIVLVVICLLMILAFGMHISVAIHKAQSTETQPTTNRQSKIENRKLKRLLDSGAGRPARPGMTASPVDMGKVSLHLARPHRVSVLTIPARGGEVGDGVPMDSLDPAPPRGKVFVTPQFAWRDLEYGILDGIWQVETECGRNLKRGDGGKAAGHIQQHEPHWIRGCEYLGVNWPWPAGTADVDKCFHVARANWYRDHLPYVIAGDVDELIRRFRRPFDPYTKCNDGYLRRVKKAMKQPQRSQRSLRTRR